MTLRHTFTYRWRAWRVFSASMAELKRAARSRTNLVGLCSSELAEIIVWEGLDENARRSTIRHELIHAVSDCAGIGLTHKQVYALEHELGPLVRLSFEEGGG